MEKEKQYKLVRTDTTLPSDKRKSRIVFIGGYLKCLGRFQSMSSFSFTNHKLYSYDHYDIVPAEEGDVVDE